MSAFLEGDLIRPLGLVTLYFGYAEFEVDALLDALSGVGLAVESPKNISLGQKLAIVRDQMSGRPLTEITQLISLLDEARPLLERRNALVHSTIVAGGRVTPSDKTRSAFTVTPEDLNQLADTIFTWKERLSALRQLHLIPALKRHRQGGTPS